jgi:hypothetical protein
MSASVLEVEEVWQVGQVEEIVKVMQIRSQEGTYINKQVFPQAPSPTITSFLRISAMLWCLLEGLVEVGKIVSLAMVCWVRSLEVEVERRGKQKHIVSV